MAERDQSAVLVPVRNQQPDRLTQRFRHVFRRSAVAAGQADLDSRNRPPGLIYELTDRGDIVRYGWQQEKPTKAELSVVPKDEFLSELINAGPNQKTYSVPHLMPHSTPILDDNFFLHREILIWRYLALGCTPKPEGLSCNPAPQQFGVLIPTQHASEIVTVDFKGKEKISLKGKDVECNSFRLHTDDNNFLVYMDDQRKVVRIVAAASGLEVLRD